jgi:TetR/AcrR family transcriptional regulator, cholesterol catabolism regulator
VGGSLIMKNGLDEILKKSSRLMATKGFHGLSMRDLAQATDRSLAGLYHYFKNKEELLYLVNFNGFSSLLKSAERIQASKLNAEEKLHAVISNHVNYFSGHRDEMRVMMFGTQELDAKRGGQIISLKDRYVTVVQRIVSDYIAKELGKNPSRREIARKTFLLFGMMNWLFSWYSPQKHGSNAELVDEIFRTLTRGILCKQQRVPSLKSFEELKNGSGFYCSEM